MSIVTTSVLSTVLLVPGACGTACNSLLTASLMGCEGPGQLEPTIPGVDGLTEEAERCLQTTGDRWPCLSLHPCFLLCSMSFSLQSFLACLLWVSLGITAKDLS